MVENNKINSIVFLGIVESNYLDLSVTSYRVVWMLIIWCCIGALCNIFLSIWLFWGIKGQVGKMGQSTSVITGTRPFINNVKRSYCNKWVGVRNYSTGPVNDKSGSVEKIAKWLNSQVDVARSSILDMTPQRIYDPIFNLWRTPFFLGAAQESLRSLITLSLRKFGFTVKLVVIKIVHACVYLIKQIVVGQLPGSVLIAVLWVFFLL